MKICPWTNALSIYMLEVYSMLEVSVHHTYVVIRFERKMASLALQWTWWHLCEKWT